MSGDHDYARLLGEATVQSVTDTFRFGRWLFGLGSQARARKEEEAKRRAYERAVRERQREWYEIVAREKSRGTAGFASEAEARAALSGKGGRKSNLDRRRF
jgi:hypothetical protein